MLSSLVAPLSWNAGAVPVSASARTGSRAAVDMREMLIAGNWKMNTLLPEAVSLAKEVAEASKTAPCGVAVCAPLPYLTAVKDALKGSKVGCDYVLSGHSERRAIFGDSDEDVNAKTLKIIKQGMKCILCIGELKEERESGETFNVLNTQLTKGLKGVDDAMMKEIVIAYEPVWAIGTGLTATPEVAQETHAYVRSWFKENYSDDVAENVVIQYGGSVNAENVDELMACSDIDGALVGGASLKGESFSAICNFKKK